MLVKKSLKRNWKRIYMTDECPECGAEIDADWNYCPHCGEYIEENDNE